jgi:hypothetical protein
VLKPSLLAIALGAATAAAQPVPADLASLAAKAGVARPIVVRDSGMHGRVAPTFPTTVVCGFVESTRAVCWQRSPATGGFVTVGGWTT